MKLQILREGQDKIENYHHITVTTNNVDLSEIVNNECDQILATDILDDFTIDAIPELISAISTKLRMNGELSIGGTDIRLFCKGVLNGIIDLNQASSVVSSISSASSLVTIEEIVSGLGLKVVDTHMTGIHFEIKAVRA
ncbi:MAG: hypothetical protein FI729_01180 [SAR202 cluster bacterium]|nr:hypothetical protein [SAR202 cluster bacterium]|tara:strand:- start:685 stop:1101 length:417 start_codon:yes stop_codon:yes gene_type:complete